MQKLRALDTRSLMLLHLAIYGMGIFGLMYSVAFRLDAVIFPPAINFIKYSDWAALSETPTKPSELLHYVLSVIALAVYFTAGLLVVKRFTPLFKGINIVASSGLRLGSYLGFSLLLNLAVWRVNHILDPLLLVLWVICMALPAWRLLDLAMEWSLKNCPDWHNWALVVLCVSVGFAFQPYLSGTQPLSNDYFDIPEKTILTTSVVDNTEYINQNQIGGLRKNNPKQIGVDKQSLRERSFIQATRTPALDTVVFSYPERYSYADKNNTLVIADQIERSDVERLLKVLSISEQESLYDIYSAQLAYKIQSSYTQENIEFLVKNKDELRAQAVAGHYFHHHHTMLGTINEYLLGKPRNETIYLYGWLSTVVVAELMTHVFGGHNFESYQTALFVFYPIYFLLLLLAAAIVFRRKEYVLLVVSLGIGSLYKLEFEAIRFAPGFNPIRHFFDVFVLICLYWYFTKPSRNLLYFVLALVFSALGILVNKEFGASLFLSLIGVIVVKAFAERRALWREFSLTGVVIVALLWILGGVTTAKNPTLLYVLLGVAAPTMHWLKMFFLLLCFSVIYIFLGTNKRHDNGWCYLALFYFFYTQIVTLYYVWNTSPNHMWALGSIWGLLLALLLRYGVTNYIWMARNEKKLLLGGNFLVLAFVLLPALCAYFMDQHRYHQIFKDHVVHKWDFPSARITTTMEPEVFDNAVRLIQKYSEGKSIYILSKYDNFLPFLAGKFSAMPFQEVALSLVTETEMDKVVDAITKHQPQYLFVDSDMSSSGKGDVYCKHDRATAFLDTYDASRGREMVLANFKKLFMRIEALYEPIEAGQLIDVYKLRLQD